MSARVLVVDDLPANVKLLEARLSAEYFDVITAYSGAGCAGHLRARRMRHRAARRHDAGHGRLRGLPQAQDQSGDAPHPGGDGDRARPALRPRASGLEAGADDFLTKPVTDVALVSRVRSLARLKMVTDELRMRALTSKEIGIQSPEREAVAETGARRAHPDRRRPQVFLRAHGRDAGGRARGGRGEPIRARRCSMPPKAITTW